MLNRKPASGEGEEEAYVPVAAVARLPRCVSRQPPLDWGYKDILYGCNMSPLRPFPFDEFAQAPEPLCREEFINWAATYHAVKQGLTFGLPLILIFLAELCILYMVSLPFEDESSTFAYEVQYNNLWVSQLFHNFYEEFPFGKAAERHDVTHVVPHVNRSIPLSDMTHVMHIELPAKLAKLRDTIERMANNNEVTLEERKRLHALHRRVAGLLGNVLYQRMPPSSRTEYLGCSEGDIARSTLDLPWYLKDIGHSHNYGSSHGSFRDHETNAVLHYFFEMEQALTQIVAELVTIMDEKPGALTPKARNMLDMMVNVHKMQHIQWLYSRAMQNMTAGTLFLSSVRDVGQHVLTNIFSDQRGKLVQFFEDRPWFDFNSSINGVFILCFYIYFRTEAFQYPYSSRVHPKPSPEIHRKPGFWKIRVRSLIPLAIILTHFTISLGLLRIIRVITYSGTLLPPNRIWCKPHRFEGQDKFGGLLTQSTPFWERLGTVLYFVVSTYGQRTGGGCSDLIYSGHVTIYVLSLLIFHKYCPHWWATAVMYIIAIEPTLHAVIKGHHYTVDCVVAVYMSFLVSYFVHNSILPRVFGKKLVKETVALKYNRRRAKPAIAP